MSGLRRAMRHPDNRSDAHERAVALASDRLLEPLAPRDADWLDAHLAECRTCRATADAFTADRALFAGLRADMPIPPRDLGARLSGALDEEVRRAVSVRRRRSSRPAGRRPSLASAVLAVAAVIAIVLLPVTLGRPGSSGLAPAGGSQQPGSSLAIAPAPTPIQVAAAPVTWVQRSTDGRYVLSSAPVDQVCPGVDSTACGTLDRSAQTLVTIGMAPSSVLLSRSGGAAVVVGPQGVYAIAVPRATSVTPSPAPPSPVQTSSPTVTPTGTGGPTTPPVGTPVPSGSPVPTASARPTPAPSATPVATASSSPTASPVPASPAGSPGTSPEPSSTPAAATVEPTIPPATPAPTAVSTLAIAEGIIVTGAPAAYSPDGRWVAFSARPADGSAGPDVYAWRVGSAKARQVTKDGASIFAGWFQDELVISQPTVDGQPAGPTADPATVVASSYLLDPDTGARQALARPAWRPVADPTSRRAIAWIGTFQWDPVEMAWVPASGSLMALDWASLLDPAIPLDLQALPGADGTDVTRWDVRWDPSARHLAVWTGIASTEAGQLTLYAVDGDGSLGAALVKSATALPAFSLDVDRLAWATPPGGNGEGSTVSVFAWTADGSGQLSSGPDTTGEPVVIAH